MSNGFDLSLVAARPALLIDRDNIVDVLIRVQAPDAPKSGLPKRQPLNLSIVIDRSGSMVGQPLYEAKRAACFMIDSLKPTDRASVVTYDNRVRVIAESCQVKAKETIKSAIRQIEAGGSTNLHGGWLKGAEEAAKHLAPSCTSRVLLLSDGQANEGLTAIDEICLQCTQLADTGVTTSTYGLGESFNEELMVAMSGAGLGSAYYCETAESLMERFKEEFSLLSSLCARSLRLFLSPMPGVRYEMLNFYEASKDGSWRLPELTYDGEAWAAVRLHVPVGCLPDAVGEDVALLQASAIYVDLKGEEHRLSETWLTLPVLPEEKFLATAENLDVVRRVKEAEAAKLQEAASRAAKKGDWKEVDALLAQAKELAHHSPWLGEIVTNLERLAAQRNDALFSKEARYAASSMSSRPRSKKEFMGDDESALPMHLQRRVQQGTSGRYSQQTPAGSYQLDRFDEYPVALIDGKRVLLDTGSPFSVGKGDRLEVAGQPFRLQGQMGITPDKLSLWMNMPIDALIGSDFLSKFVVTMDWWRSSVVFSPRGSSLSGEELPVEKLMGTPVLGFNTVNGQSKALFHTGSRLGYMPRSAVGSSARVNHVQDFHPMIGTFETDVHEVMIEIAGHPFIANCGLLPESLAGMLAGTTGTEWIIGTDLLRQGAIGLDLRRNHITASWSKTGSQ